MGELHQVRGRIRWGALFWVLFLGAVVYAALNLIPAYMDVYRFEDSVQEIMMGLSAYSASARGQTERRLRDEILRLAGEYNIPVQDPDIQFRWFTDRVIVELHIVREVPLQVYTWRIERHVRAERRFF
ncbi:MAG: hypothetical protein NZ742_03865 [Acidobacteria bacterium]|nr:hypothetical protein [Acidobacteriota bacterium]MDW7984055.1 hypothetical protein [Acidobacteriota bacterium]